RAVLRFGEYSITKALLDPVPKVSRGRYPAPAVAAPLIMGGVSETILVVLIGRKETGQTDPYQLLQEEVAEAEGVRAGVRAEIVFAPGFPAGGHVLCVTGPLRSSAAVERLQAMKAVLGPGITLAETEAGQWTEPDGIFAFESWYALHKARRFTIDAIAGQSDDLAVG